MERVRAELDRSLVDGIPMKPPRSVWEDRINRCRNLMDDKGLDALLVYAGGQVLTGREWARYFANYKEPLWNSEAFVFIPNEGELTLILNYTHMVEPTKNASYVRDIRAYESLGSASRYDELGKMLKSLLAEKGLEKAKIGLARHGMQGDFVPSLLDQTLSVACKNATLMDASSLLWELVRVKMDYDLEMLVQCNKVLGTAAAAALGAVKDGNPEYKCYSAFWGAACEGGAEVDEMASCHLDMQSAPGREIRNKPFSVTLRRMKKGEMVTIDLGVTYCGYVSDIARTAVVGPPSKEQRRIFEATMAGHFAMRDALTDGVTSAEICQANFKELGKLGFSEKQAHALQGHGIGFMKNEPPILQPWNRCRIGKGEVVNLETQLMIPNVARVYMEDTYLVTSGNPKRISVTPPELYVG